MATYTIYEYSNVTPNGEPIEPPSVRTIDADTGTPVQLASSTVYVAVKAAAAMHLRIGHVVGDVADTADHALEADKTYGFPVRAHARPWVDGV